MKNISDSIYKELLASIRFGEYSAGEFLPSENQLTKILGVSRSTVRIVLKRLQEDEILSNHPGKGWLVVQKHNVDKPIAVMLANSTGPHMPLLETIKAECNKRSWNMLVFYNPDLQDDLSSFCNINDISALLIISGLVIPEKIEKECKSVSLPLIALSCSDKQNYHTISADHYHNASLLMDLVNKEKFTQTVFLTIAEETTDISYESRLLACQSKDSNLQVWKAKDNMISSEEAELIFSKWKKGSNVCFLCASYELLVNFLKHCCRLSYKIPKDYSVIGFQGTIDEFEKSLLQINRACAFEFPAEQITKKAFSLLEKIFSGETVPPKFNPITQKTEVLDTINNS